MSPYPCTKIVPTPALIPTRYLPLEVLIEIIHLLESDTREKRTTLVVFPDGRPPLLASSHYRATLISAMYLLRDLPPGTVSLPQKKGA